MPQGLALAVDVRDLRRSYGKVVALDDVSVRVAMGELVSILGPNGAGKTTLVRHLYCELRPEGGEVSVLGGSPCSARVKRRVGLAPQEATPFDELTVEDNLYYMARLKGMEGRRARARAAEVIGALGLEEHRRKFVADLSGGLKRRTLIGMALMNDPDLLVLDEPTTGLDPVARRSLWEVLRGLRREGRAIVLTTHYMDEAEQLSDRVYFMNRRIVAEGTPADLRARFSVYYEVVDYSTGRVHKVREDEIRGFISRLPGKFEVRLPSLEDVYLEVIGDA